MKCQQCNHETNNPKFCSRSCAVKYNNHICPKRQRNIAYCKYCNKEQSRTATKYCNNVCQRAMEQTKFIERWLAGNETGISGQYEISQHIKRYLFDKYNNKCSQCGWSQVNQYTHRIPQEVDHIDGNFQNNKEDNLRLLCPNCHALTPSYKGANKGNGRTARRKYYQPSPK